MRKLSEGAESELYISEFAGIPAVVKHRSAKGYRIPEMDEQIRSERTKKEARLISIANSNGVAAPRILLVGKYDLWMEIIDGDILANLMKGGAVRADIFNSAGAYFGMLHSSQISHGDCTPANIMVDKGGKVYIIDFGLGERTKAIEDMAMDLMLMKRSVSKKYYSSFIEGYKSTFKPHKETIGRVSAIEKRGRYSTRTMQTG